MQINMFPSPTLMQILGVGHCDKQLAVLILSLLNHYRRRKCKKVAQLKDCQPNIKTLKNCVENVITIWYFYFFNYLIGGKLYSLIIGPLRCDVPSFPIFLFVCFSENINELTTYGKHNWVSVTYKVD